MNTVNSTILCRCKAFIIKVINLLLLFSIYQKLGAVNPNRINLITLFFVFKISFI